MPSRKIFTVLIICFGIVTSVWLVSSKTSSSNNKVALKDASVTAEPSIKIENTNYDWQKILVTANPENQKIIDLTKNNNSTAEDDSTLTDQMARDFLSQYLIAVKDGTEITPEVANQIAQRTLALPEYRPSSVVYIKENLKITTDKSATTLQKYQDAINQATISIYYSVKNDPIEILITSLQTEKETDSAKFDPIIAINKEFIRDLLKMEVPESAVNVHLSLLNTSSTILSDLESMRVAVSDPVKVFSSVGQYYNHLNAFKNSLKNIDQYLKSNSVLAQ